MAAGWRRGRLRDGAEAPELGEDVQQILRLPGIVIEQILSGTLEAPVDYRQEHDEWVVLLAGRATLEVDGETIELSAGDWLFLPARIEHRLVTTAPRSSWLAVHVGLH